VPISNRALLEKADMALADLITSGGYLKPAQAQKFMLLMVKEGNLLPMVTVTPMPSPKFETSGVKFGGRVLRPGRENTALTEAERSAPQTNKVELDAQLFKAQTDLPDEVLEDNIERGEFRQTVMTLLAKAISRDMEDVILNGSRLSTDPTLAVLDGVVTQARSTVVDAVDGTLDRSVLFQMLRALPNEYLRDKKAMRFLVASGSELTYRNSLIDRATAVGDQLLQTDAPVMFAGVPIESLPMLPETLGAAGNQTVALLCHPKNINVGIYRQIRFETARDIEKGVLKIVATLRFDVKWMEEPGVCKAVNIRA
jgi:HK97 family phage major capsid protein